MNPFTETEIKALLNAPDNNIFVGYRDFVIKMGKGNKERTVYFQYKIKEHLKRYFKVRGELNHDYLFIGRLDNPLSNKAIQDRLTL